VTANNAKCCVAIDLTPITAGGENGGHKIAVLNYISKLQRLDRFQFVLIGTVAARADLLPLLKENDLYLETWFPVVGAPVQIRHSDGKAKHTFWRAKFLQHLGVDLLYSPFGTIHYSEQGLPLVSWVADLLHRDCPMTLSPWQIQAREDGLTIATRESVIVQTNTEFIARKMVRAYGVPRDRLIVLPPLPQELPRPKYLNVAENSYFFYPANFWAHKNHRALLSAYREYRSKSASPVWTLVLTGHPGVEQERVKRFAQELGLKEEVQFLGFLDGNKFTEWFAQAGCLLFPSLYEGFGMPLVEAMRLQVPIVAANAACIPEICGDAFVKVDPTDIHEMAEAMLSISTNEPLRRTLITAGVKRQELFEATALVNRLAQLLTQAAKTEKIGPALGRSPATNVLRLKLLAERFPRKLLNARRRRQ
jgi:glycosyltransferase involved in cell wall biosynthesis